MPRIVLVHCFIDPAVEGEVVLIVLETSGAAEDARGAGLLVDSCWDGEVVHAF